MAISFAPIRYELLHGKYGAYLVEEIMRFPILNAAPVTIAATIFGTSSDKNTNGEKLKNNNIFVINISLQHSIAPANVILLAPPRYPKKQVDKNVMATKIIVHMKSINYFPKMNFPRDNGIVIIVFKLCSVYSLPNMYETTIAKRTILNMEPVN